MNINKTKTENERKVRPWVLMISFFFSFFSILYLFLNSGYDAFNAFARAQSTSFSRAWGGFSV